MRGAKQHFTEWLYLSSMFLNLGSKHVSEHVSPRGVGVVQVVPKLVTQPAALGISHEVGLDAEIISEVDVKLAASTEYIETGDEWRHVGMDVDKGKANRDFHFWNVWNVLR